jgi:hypothetical protein
MSTYEDACRIARELPGTTDEHIFGVYSRGKWRGFAWAWKERIHPKKPREPNYQVLAVRTADLDEKEMLLAADTEKFFTEPHYNNYPAVLVRLQSIDVDELTELLTDSWRNLATRELLAEYEELASRC